MVDVSQVTRDAPPATAVKHRKPKSALADIVRSLLSHLRRRALTDQLTAEQSAELDELIRRLHGNA